MVIDRSDDSESNFQMENDEGDFKRALIQSFQELVIDDAQALREIEFVRVPIRHSTEQVKTRANGLEDLAGVAD